MILIEYPKAIFVILLVLLLGIGIGVLIPDTKVVSKDYQNFGHWHGVEFCIPVCMYRTSCLAAYDSGWHDYATGGKTRCMSERRAYAEWLNNVGVLDE